MSDFYEEAGTARNLVSKMELTVIYGSIFALLPLFFIDQDLIGIRRVGWIGAFITQVIFYSEMPPTNDLMERLTIACLIFSLVPHVTLALRKSLLMALAVLPPIGMAIYINLSQPDRSSPEYWQSRAFLSSTIVLLPYLNHLDRQQSRNRKAK